MKARIKKTGEILNVASYAAIAVDKCDDWGNPVEYPVSEVEIIPDIEPLVFDGVTLEPDWEQRRYEIVKDILVQLIAHEDGCIRNEWSRMKSQYVKDAIEDADAIIKELKETKQ